jgi:hypothetical protein
MDVARVLALLMHANRAVHAVVDDDEQNGQAVLHGRREFLPAHQEATIAGKADDRAFGMHRFRGDGGGNAVTHRARSGRELRTEAPISMKPLHPTGVVAGTVRDHRVGRQRLREMLHHFPHLQVAGNLHAALPVIEVFIRRDDDFFESRARHARQICKHPRHGRHGGVDHEIGLINAAQLFRARVHVHELLRGHRRIDHAVSAGGHLAEPCAETDHEVRCFDPGRESGIDAYADVARVVRMCVVEEVLEAKRTGDRQALCFNEIAQVIARGRCPAAAADD